MKNLLAGAAAQKKESLIAHSLGDRKIKKYKGSISVLFVLMFLICFSNVSYGISVIYDEPVRSYYLSPYGIAGGSACTYFNTVDGLGTYAEVWESASDEWPYAEAGASIQVSGTLAVDNTGWIYLNFLHEGFLQYQDGFASSSFGISIGNNYYNNNLLSMFHSAGWSPHNLCFGYDVLEINAEFFWDEDFYTYGNGTQDVHVNTWVGIYLETGIYGFDLYLDSYTGIEGVYAYEYWFDYQGYALSNFRDTANMFVTDENPGEDLVIASFGEPSAPAPEPSTWILLFFGVVGMLGIKKKLS